MKTIVFAAVLFLAGCGESVQPTVEIGSFGSVKEVELSDGTVCAVFKQGYAGGISCNWKTP